MRKYIPDGFIGGAHPGYGMAEGYKIGSSDYPISPKPKGNLTGNLRYPKQFKLDELVIGVNSIRVLDKATLQIDVEKTNKARIAFCKNNKLSPIVKRGRLRSFRHIRKNKLGLLVVSYSYSSKEKCGGDLAID